MGRRFSPKHIRVPSLWGATVSCSAPLLDVQPKALTIVLSIPGPLNYPPQKIKINKIIYSNVLRAVWLTLDPVSPVNQDRLRNMMSLCLSHAASLQIGIQNLVAVEPSAKKFLTFCGLCGNPPRFQPKSLSLKIQAKTGQEKMVDDLWKKSAWTVP